MHVGRGSLILFLELSLFAGDHAGAGVVDVVSVSEVVGICTRRTVFSMNLFTYLELLTCRCPYSI